MLNSVILQVTKAFVLNSDRNRYHSLIFPRTCKAQYSVHLYTLILLMHNVHICGIFVILYACFVIISHFLFVCISRIFKSHAFPVLHSPV